ncbi:MAG: excinuclease ABC subunit UvrA [Gemmatimonadetes bacterium]|nr:excinuclease ABC subunit UvrA [Gemmatimonadota bacterium]
MGGEGVAVCCEGGVALLPDSGAIPSMDDWIRIRGARQHNLRNLDIDLPRRALTVITGPSGSGKSSLALDTLFAEGQRRYVESLSTYAKQFLERMEKPDVDSIEGISPAVAIEQKNPTKSSRSTVGTATEVYDYLRLLWARVGRTYCPECGDEVRPDSVTSAAARVLTLPEGTRIQVTFPLKLSGRVKHGLVVENLRTMGFVRILADGVLVDLGEDGAETVEHVGFDLTEVAEALVVVDRLAVSQDDRDRLADSLSTCFIEGEGEAIVLIHGGGGGAGDGGREVTERLAFTEHFRCPKHPEIEFFEPTPKLFSFNNPYGSCPVCTGFGSTLDYDVDLIVPNDARSIDEGAVDPWSKPRYHRERAKLRSFTLEQNASLYSPWAELPEDFREAVLYGAEGFKGVIPFLVSRERKRYKHYIRVFLRQYQSPQVCRACGGARIQPGALYIKIGTSTISDVNRLPIEDVQGWVGGLELSEMEARIAETILRELHARLAFLVDVGLGYVALDRQMRTLSGGEAQRINLANSLGSRLVDTLYVLDEPTVGLHPKDTSALLALLGQLRDAGNSVVVVEHDPLVIREADHVLELGPGSGEKGGSVVFQGSPDELAGADSTTGLYISGRAEIPVPAERRCVDGARLNLTGGRLHNLEGVDVEIPLEAMTVVTGVSGSGKSTLVHDLLYHALEGQLKGGETSAKEHLGEVIGEVASLEGATMLDEVVLVDQSPIGRTPRSNPVTYIKAWDEVRKLFAAQPLARKRRYTAGAFSFNVKGGRCEACKGAGNVEIEMIFMADVYVQCDACRGTRYRPEMLEVRFKGRNVAEVLDLTVDEAIRFFIRQDRLGRILWQLQQVGLGYLKLGQPAPTLSGGEAQRLKIARELARVSGKKGRKLYILDEPTTGLSGEDIRKLLHVLDRLVDAENSVLVIEHNLEVVKAADWVIDMGPGAGARGGQVVAMGRPEELVSVPESETGRYLADVLD